MFKNPIKVDVNHNIDIDEVKDLIDETAAKAKTFLIRAGIVIVVGAGALILLAAAAAVAGDVVSDKLTDQ